MAAAFAAALAKARTVIAALTPTTATPTSAYTDSTGDLPLADEPPVASDRVFAVCAGDSLDLGPVFGTGYEEHVRTMEVRVRYANRGATDTAAADLDATEDRMAEDADQIAKALTTTSNLDSGTRIVEFAGAAIDRTDPDFPALTLTFRVDYYVAL